MQELILESIKKDTATMVKVINKGEQKESYKQEEKSQDKQQLEQNQKNRSKFC